MDTAILDNIQKSDDWLAEYNRTIGSSRAAAVCNASPWQTPGDVYDAMTNGAAPPEITPDMKRGAVLEHVALMILQQETGRDVIPHPQDHFLYSGAGMPWAHTLPDAHMPEPQLVVEAKVPRPENWQRVYMDGLPRYWHLQCQHTIAVMDAPAVLFVALNPVTLQLLRFEVERDDETVEMLTESEAAFWELLKRGSRPEDRIDGSTRRQIAEEPTIRGHVLKLGGDRARKAAVTYFETRALAEEVGQLVDDAKSRLNMAACAEAASTPLVGCFEVEGIGRFYNLKSPGRRTFDHKTAVARNPSLEQFYKQGAPFTSFRAYAAKSERRTDG